MPSVTSTPILRPAKLAGPLPTMLRAGDGGRSVIGARAGVDGSGYEASRRPSATRRASVSSTLRRLATMRARMPGCSHLDSSNTKPSTMCVCSTGVWLTKNCRAWL